MQISNSDLKIKLKTLVAQERQKTLEVLNYLRLADERRAYAEWGHSSMFVYCVKELGYSEGAAFRRVNSMRLLKEIPEVSGPVQSGEINLSQLSLVHQFAKTEKIGKETKLNLLQQIKGISMRETERKLASQATQRQTFQTERTKPVSSQLVRIELIVPQEMLDEIDDLKARLSHALPRPDLQSTLWYAVKTCLRKKKREVASLAENKMESKIKTPINSAQPPKSNAEARAIPRGLKRQVWQRDKGCCTFPGCGSKMFLQLDHVFPVALGGATTLDNLRLFCFQHNQWSAQRAGLLRGSPYLLRTKAS